MRYIYILFTIVLVIHMLPAVWSQPSADDTIAKYRYMDAINAARDNLDSGITILWQLIGQGKQKENYRYLFQGYFGLGAVYSNKGDYAQSMDYYKIAFAYSIKTKYPVSNACRVLNNIGHSYLMQGNYREAAFYCFKAALLAEQEAGTDNVIADQLVRIYNNISTSLLYMNEYNRALYYLEKAEALANRLQHGILLPSIFNNKALMYKKTGDRETAWRYYKRAILLARKHQHYQEEHVALRGMADLLISRQRYTQAIPYLEEASGIRGVLHPSHTAKTLGTLGHVYFLQGDYTNARAALHASLSKAVEANAFDCMLDAHRQLALLYAGMHRYRQAFEHMQAAYQFNDSLLNHEKVETVSRMEVKYRTAQKDKEIAQNQLFINDQNRKLYQQNTWIWISSLGILLLTSTSLFLFVLYRSNRQKQLLQEQRISGMEKEQEIAHLKAILEGEEKERTRIARELHDGIGSQLAAVKMNFSSLQEHCTPILPEQNKRITLDRFTKIMDMLNETGTEIRETAYNLMPDILEKHGLEEALNLYCEKINTSSSIYLHLDIQGATDRLPDALRLPVYRIIQELVQNTLKHAEAANAFVRLTVHEDDRLSVLVRDNGKGFDPAARATGMGLQNIRSRVQVLYGSMLIDSSTNAGTTVNITIDLSNFKNTPSYEHSDSHSG